MKKAKEGKVKSYVQDTAAAVHDAIQESKSKEEFIENMKQKYNLPIGKDELTELFKKKSLQKEHSARHRRR